MTPHPSRLTPRPTRFARLARDPRWLLVAALVGVVAACKPSIGDQCVLSTDCSTQGDRLCDTSQPGGYCTQFNCSDYSCPDKAVCVLFNAAVQGCDYDDRAGHYGSRVARSFCVAHCTADSDCRGGYICADPHSPPWSGVILDDDKSRRACLVPPPGYDPDAGADAAIMSVSADAGVCRAVGPVLDPIEAGAALGSDSGRPPLVVDAGTDAGDAGDAGDGGDGG